MEAPAPEHDLTLWLVDGVPARMYFGGRRWSVTDTPTRLRGALWPNPPASLAAPAWRFQATDPRGQSFVFDVYEDGGHWHVHRAYA
jgi:hypothetical protein